jgi:hypothetical protein
MLNFQQSKADWKEQSAPDAASVGAAAPAAVSPAEMAVAPGASGDSEA